MSMPARNPMKVPHDFSVEKEMALLSLSEKELQEKRTFPQVNRLQVPEHGLFDLVVIRKEQDLINARHRYANEILLDLHKETLSGAEIQERVRQAYNENDVIRDVILIGPETDMALSLEPLTTPPLNIIIGGRS